MIGCELPYFILRKKSLNNKKYGLERTVLNMEIEKQETLNAKITSELRGYLEGINATINERTKTEQ